MSLAIAILSPFTLPVVVNGAGFTTRRTGQLRIASNIDDDRHETNIFIESNLFDLP
ncbi:hypothetical protein GTU79_11640 [Sodalis ligni]|nr:hypothetical protein GTU79_11640 [Sodalis ligni]